MRIHFDHEGLGFTLEILANPILNNVINKSITGVRKVNQVLLSDQNFKRVHSAIVTDDFNTIREILAGVIDISDNPSEILRLDYLSNKLSANDDAIPNIINPALSRQLPDITQ